MHCVGYFFQKGIKGTGEQNEGIDRTSDSSYPTHLWVVCFWKKKNWKAIGKFENMKERITLCILSIFIAFYLRILCFSLSCDLTQYHFYY